MKNVIKIGHRGASGNVPENTITAFKKSIELGADMVELDVHLCKSGEAIVLHDETVDRTTNGSGSIHDKTLDELKKLTIIPNETIPTLEEVIQATKRFCKLNIEVKNKEPAKKVLQSIQDNQIQKDSMVSSNYIKPLQTINAAKTEVETALIFWATKSNFRQFLFSTLCLLFLPITHWIILYRAKKAKVQWINLMKPIVDTYLVRKLHKHGYKVVVWTVDNPKQIKKMRQRGVDAIMSNFPERL